MSSTVRRVDVSGRATTLQSAAIRSPPVQHQPVTAADSELMCKICLNPYNGHSKLPRTLHCQHTFCEQCIADRLLNAPKDRQQQKLVGPRAVLTCPLCRGQSRLNESGLIGLHVNTAILNRVALADDRSTPYGQLLANSINRARTSPGGANSGTGMEHHVIPQRIERLHPPPSRTDDVITELPTNSTPTTETPEPKRHKPKQIKSVGFSNDGDEVIRYPTTDFSLTQQDIDYMFDTDSPAAGADGTPLNDVDVAKTAENHLRPTAIYIGRFGKYNDSRENRPGSFHQPSSIRCFTGGGVHVSQQLVVVDRGGGADGSSSVIQLFAANGDCLSMFRVEGATAACFVADGDRIAVATTTNGIAICNRQGQVEKTLPLGDVISMATYRRGFIAAHSSRLSICESYQPTAVLRTIGGVTGTSGMQNFQNIIDVAVGADKICVVDSAVTYVIDVLSGKLLYVIGSGPVGISLDPDSGEILLADPVGRQVLGFNGRNGRLEGCLVRMGTNGPEVGAVRCCGLAISRRGSDGRQVLYVAVCGQGVAEVQMYRM